MEEKKKITSSDKIPGCERLTRPEEIKGLSKYLGAIRETQEDWIEDNMPDERGKLEIEVDQIDKLPKSKINIRPSDLESLPDAVVGLDDDSKVKLPKESSKLHDIPETKIIPDISKLKVDSNEKLPKDKERLGGEDKKVEIPKEKLGIENDREPQELPDSVIGISDKKDVRLPKSRIGIGDVIDEISELPDSVLGVDDDRKISLPKDKENIWPEEIKNLPKDKDKVPSEINDPRLPSNKEIRPGEEEDIKIPAGVEYIYPADPSALPKTKIKRGSEDKDIELPGDTIKPTAAISDVPSLPEILERPDISAKDIDSYLSSRKTSELYTDIIDSLTLGENGKINNGNTKLLGILSSQLGKEEMNQDQVKSAGQALFQYFQTQKALINAAILEYPEKEKRDTTKNSDINIETIDLRRKVKRGGEVKSREEANGGDAAYYVDGDLRGKTPNRVPYHLPDNIFLEYGNPDTYIRQLAELATYGANGQGWFGKGNSGMSGLARRMLLDTTLKALVATRRWTEKKLEINRDRLPGHSNSTLGTIGKVVGGIKTGVKAIENFMAGDLEHALGDAASLFDVEDIKNRPTTIKDKNAGGRLKIQNPDATITYHSNLALDENGKLTKAAKKSVRRGKVTSNSLLGPFIGNVEDTGLALTIKDLCGKSISNMNTVDQIKDALISSPYTTSPYKYMKAFGAQGGNYTLDTNAYWEVIIEPLCDKGINGGWSFLPHIHEINKENEALHGWNTHYDKWIPLSNLELQKSKLNSRTLALFEGEISYPVSVEYTNELRMTVIDDQYKSWRRYFQRCADVSVYSSEGHDSKWYKERNEDGNHMVRPTAIDKSKFCVAYYKNVAFRVRIYFMTPQFSTIKSFDLLCVLKDFSEEYYGEVEGGGQDLNVSFSIVGENPLDHNVHYRIDSNGVGAWIYGTEEGTQYLGTNVSQAILSTENNRKTREDQAAQGAINGKK